MEVANNAADVTMVDKRLNYGRPVVARFLQSIAPFSTVLDIGAGTGADLAVARDVSPQAQCFAVESFAPNVEVLRAQGVDVRAGDIERDSLFFSDAMLDVVLTNQTMEHVKEVFWIMHEVSRVLKVGGHFIVGVPNLASLHNRLLLSVGKQPTCLQNHSAHVRGYTRHDMLRFFGKVFPGGYVLEGFGGGNFYPFPSWAAKPLATAFPNMAWAIFMLFRKTRPYQAEFLEYPVEQKLESNFFLGPVPAEAKF